VSSSTRRTGRLVGRPQPRRPDVEVFLDRSGSRWKRLRALGLLLLAVLIGAAVVVVPKALAPPPLEGEPIPDGPSPEEIGRPAVIGEGPLARVVRVVSQDGRTVGIDPFTDEVVTRLSEEEVRTAAGAEYAIERHGYAPGTHRTISLTFDDGPDPVWTPRLLDLLSEHHVRATFFVTGERMIEYPEIMRRIVREGHAIGNHTLTHVDVSEATSFRQQLEMVVTDRVLRDVTGHYASWFRLPYEGDDDASMRRGLPGILRAQQMGYIVVSQDFDPQDWAYTSGRRSGEIPLPPLGEQDNITVLLHDAGGGDRARTLEYVEELVTRAEREDYTFTSMPQVHPELAASEGRTEPTTWDEVTHDAVDWLVVWPGSMLHVLFVLAVVTMVGFGFLNVVLALVRYSRSRHRLNDDQPTVAVLIAALNEEMVITRTIEHVLASDYPVGGVVVVDDGSTDGTADMVRDIARRDPRVRLVQQENAGKWAALNHGFRLIPQEIVVTIDADTLVTPSTVRHLVAGFHSSRIGAVAGVVRVGNRTRNLLTRWQALEYVTQIGVERAGAALLRGVMVVPGACAAWRRLAVTGVGGYSGATLAEDCDLTLTLHRGGWEVEQADLAVAWTEAPEAVDALLRQRVRWMFGTFQAVWKHRSMLFRPRYGWLGMLVMPMTVVSLVMPLVFTPLVVVALLQVLAAQGPLQVLLYFALFAAVYGVLAVVAVWLLRERPGHLLMVPVYRFIYEPMRAYLLYACLGTALRGVRLGWNRVLRTAHMDADPEIAPRPAPVHVTEPAGALQ
jgi:peptidoglycan-N-acetylglucosamine deacetylase